MVSVFAKGNGGWSDSALVAELVASSEPAHEDVGHLIAASKGTVVTASYDAQDQSGVPTALYVFQEPAGGWSGLVYSSAKLISSDPACPSFDDVMISGSTVAAGCSSLSRTAYSPGLPILVFTEPAGGWTGTRTQSAALVASGAQSIEGGLAISGSTVFSAAISSDLSREYALAFREPAGGWSGTVHQSATFTINGLPGIGAGAVSGDMLFLGGPSNLSSGEKSASVLVYRKPPRGWTGTIHPRASLDYPGLFAGDEGPYLAVSGRTVAVGQTDTYDGAGVFEHGCPCYSYLDVFREPASGWSGTLAPQASTRFVGSNGLAELAVQGRTVFAGTQDPTMRIFHETAPPAPRASGFSLTGLNHRNPRLTVQIAAQDSTEPIVAVTIRLPRGLRFTARHKQLVTGTTVVGEAPGVVRPHHLTLRSGTLTVRLLRPPSAVKLTIQPPAITETGTLQHRIQNATKHKPVSPRTLLTVLDAAGDITRLTLPADR